MQFMCRTQKVRRMRALYYLTFALLVAVTAMHVSVSAGEKHEHGDDFVIGVSSGGQLKFEAEPVEENEIFSLETVSGILNGWAGDEPGFMPLDKDEPDEDFFPLAIGAEIQLVLVSIDPALKAHTPGFGDVIDQSGDAWTIATVTTDPPAFDEHPTWHIDSDDPSLALNQVVWKGTFKFVDAGSTAYADSEEFTLRFSNAHVEDCIPGDVNLDGKHDRNDVCSFIQAVDDPGSMSPDQKCGADTDQDGYVTEMDALRFYKPLVIQLCEG